MIRRQQEHAHDGLPFSAGVQYRLGALRIRFTSLWREIRQFGQWLESRAFPAVRDAGRSQLVLELEGGCLRLGRKLETLSGTYDECGKLCAFLGDLGIRRLQLDPRLESNQVVDILVLLFAFRRGIRGGQKRTSGRGLAGSIAGGTAVQFACAQARIHDQTLSVTYSYCATRFSRIVRWFTQRHRHFQDHRALFHAAPRYGLLAALTVMGIFLIYSFFDGWWLLLTVSALAAAGLFAMVYLFFMSVGSVEYDNEEKAFRLGEAYAKLKSYAQRTQEDLHRARQVQNSILPDLSNMPMAGRIDWAASFLPEAEVGGDYFDAASVGDGRVAILFSDVSGHGLAAALITAVLKTAFQIWTDEGGTLTDFIRAVNRDLYRITPDGSYAALFVATYDARTGELSYINCGHHPEPWLIPGPLDRPLIQLSGSRALLLGVEEGIAAEPAKQALEPGDRLFLATDGLIEAQDLDGQMYGMERLEGLLRSGRGDSVEELVRRAVKDVGDFVNGAEQRDDRTVLSLQIKPQQ